MIKGILFDMDGLLLDTEKYYFMCWIKSAEEFGFSMKPHHALAVRSLSSKYAEPFLIIMQYVQNAESLFMMQCRHMG